MYVCKMLITYFLVILIEKYIFIFIDIFLRNLKLVKAIFLLK